MNNHSTYGLRRGTSYCLLVNNLFYQYNYFKNSNSIMNQHNFVIVILMVSTFFANAQINPVSPAQGYSTFIEGNATLLENETEGNVAIGGDLILNSGANYRTTNNTAGSVVFGSDSRPTGLLINGKVQFNGGVGIAINSSAWVKIGDCTGSNIYDTDNNGASSNTVITNGTRTSSPKIQLQTIQPVSTVCESNLLDFAAAFDTMRDYSTGLAACTENIYFLDQNGNALASPNNPSANTRINCASNTINILNTYPSAFDNISNITFQNLSATSPLIVNINGGGSDFSWQIPAFAGHNPRYIFWNFVDIPTLTFTGGNTLEGTVYAPASDFYKNNTSNIQGSIVAKTLVATAGEIHEFPWGITLTPCAVANEICGNNMDDDNDGKIDCADTDCAPFINSVTSTSPDCSTPSSGEIVISATVGDVLSYSIANETTWLASPTFSNLGVGQYTIRVKNNHDCETEYTLNPVILDFDTCFEICDNGLDDDGDGKIDCEDSDCDGVGTSNKVIKN